MTKLKLVKIRKAAVTKGAPYWSNNREIVENDGWLWFVVREEAAGAHLKSLATGAEIFWLEEEYEEG